MRLNTAAYLPIVYLREVTLFMQFYVFSTFDVKKLE